MDFAFNEEQEMLRETSRRFLEAESPLSRVRELFDDALGFDRVAWTNAAELGWYGMFVPERYGGGSLTNQPLIDLVVVAEELGRLVQPSPFLPTNVVAFAIARSGSEEQKQTYLPGLASGSLIATWCFAEQGADWDEAAFALSAEKASNGYVLRGEKRFVQDAQAADLFLVTARTDSGLVQLLVPSDAPGIEMIRLQGIDLARRLHDVRLDGVAVPESAALGELGSCQDAIVDQIHIATVLQCAESAAGAEQLVAMCVEYAKNRVQFDKPIGSFQAIKHKIADLYIEAYSASCATHYAALAIADGQSDAAAAVAIAKMYVGDAYARIAGESLQVHGGIGFTWESDVHLYLRRAKSNQVLFGDPDWHREKLCQALGA